MAGSNGIETPKLRLELRGVTKRFPGVLANDNVHVAVKPGEIHALLGENGAGKSTLVKMIYGILAPDAGEVIWDGEPVRVANPRAARKLGIGMVFQHFSLFEALTVLENISLGLDSKLSQRDLEAEIRRVLDIYGLKLDPRRIVSTLSVGERQRIEIVRALLLNPRLLIMDEPTSVLTPQEVEQLFETLRKLAAGGCSILYISHKLHEIIALCDTATILRGGRVVAHCDPKTETSKSMAELMIGATESIKEGLKKYSRQGVYANYFYGENRVDFKSDLVVIETEELKNMADLQSVILQMFTLTITSQIFMGDRTRRCLICIDEAWDLLKSPQMEGFIESLASGGVLISEVKD